MKKNNLLLATSILMMCSSCQIISNDSNDIIESKDESKIEISENVVKDNSNPSLSNCIDLNFEIENRIVSISSLKLKDNVKAIDKEDGDISSQIKVTVTNHYTKEEVSFIDLSTDGLFDLFYEIFDKDGGYNYDLRYIVVGDPYTNLDDNGNEKKFKTLSASELQEIEDTYEVIFEEDFNYEGMPGEVEGENDYNAYTYQLGGGGWGNNELQTYEKNQRTCYVSDGYLKISAIKENGKYYSARLNTKNSFSANWTYGKYEVVAKLPQGNGPWPAIWMMPNDSSYGSWPKSGEIDIMETSQYYKNKILGTIHTEAYYHSIGTQKVGYHNDSTIYTTFNKYSIEWLPDRMLFKFNDKVYFSYKPSDFTSNVTYKQWPFNKPFHFIFNIAMGGMMGGTISDTLYDDYGEVAMFIDSIKVSQSTYVNSHFSKK